MAARRGDEALIVARASGATYEYAARRVRVAVRTVKRRMADAAFRRVVEARALLFDQVLGPLAANHVHAAATLIHALDGEAESVWLPAALGIFNTGLKLRTAGELDQRLHALEAMLGLQEPGETA